MTENLRTAWIAAVAAVLGACLAGGATYLAANTSERAEDRRQESQVDERARGVARALRSELSLAALYGSVMVDRDEWIRPDDFSFTVALAQEDLQLVFGRLNPREYRIVTDALQLSTIADLVAGKADTGESLGDRRSFVEDVVKSFEAASDALRGTADLAKEE